MPSRHFRARSRQMVRAALQDVASARENDRIFMASVAAAALVARADGWVDPTERERLIAWMDDVALLEGLAASEVEAAFDLRLRQFEQPNGIDTAMDLLRRAAGASNARLVMEGAEQVARADGQVRPSEAAALRLVRRAVFPGPWARPAASFAA